ncbi:hypothetical protein [Anoxybacteroides amylolyticum]|uniref:Bacteriocin biosynthesis cyclodehydratase domain protein n=1 Tax=Anoxybacteroides amylolyticum TaxID=294699 RepID=A0A160F698_9BACL|nr:hypothetical protein [Anoxybacillus amylolyticus]ANB62127.1 hypothetical protein GFC30_2995 [Anoxybacillus amylolyticus]
MKIQLFEIGEFANRIGDMISKELEPDRVKVENNSLEKLPVRHDADLYMVISEHLCVDLCKYIDNISRNYKKYFLPIVMDHPYLTVGPFVQYSQGACYHCYYGRFMQHNPAPHVTRALEKHYRECIGKGPKGYHPLDAAIVSNWLIYSVKNSFNHFQGKLWRMNLVSRESVTSKVIGIHGCKRCGSKKDEKTRSYFALLNRLIGSYQEGEEYCESIK